MLARGQGPVDQCEKLVQVNDAVALDVSLLQHLLGLLLRQLRPEPRQHLAQVGRIDEPRLVHVEGVEGLPQLVLQLLVRHHHAVRVRVPVRVELAARERRQRAHGVGCGHHDAELLERDVARLEEVEAAQHLTELRLRHHHAERGHAVGEVVEGDALCAVAVEQLEALAELRLPCLVRLHARQPALRLVAALAVQLRPVADGAHAAERRQRVHRRHQLPRPQLTQPPLHLRHRGRRELSRQEPPHPRVLLHRRDRNPLLGLELEHGCHQVTCLRGNVRPVWRRKLEFADLRDHDDAVLAGVDLGLLEGKEPAQQHVQQHPRAPHVHRRAVRPPLVHFRRHKVGRPAPRHDAGPP
mmetsp:Transcript_18090/g.36596  ORF Transcript_18090/g.36596 Transcript_18090/m.36596 type:complete len:354 (-) Transcript_18090:256-1317(-)